MVQSNHRQNSNSNVKDEWHPRQSGVRRGEGCCWCCRLSHYRIFVSCHRLQPDQSSPREHIPHNSIFLSFPSSSNLRGRWGRNGRHQGKVKEIVLEKKRGREWESLARFGTAHWVGGVQEMRGKHEYVNTEQREGDGSHSSS